MQDIFCYPVILVSQSFRMRDVRMILEALFQALF